MVNILYIVRNVMNILMNAQGSVSPYNNYCDGYGNHGASGNNYFLGVVLGIGVAPLELGHAGSVLLDEINAFDRAEVEDTTIGQINMTIVSSFCGPQGVIWGYDVVKASNLKQHISYAPKNIATKNKSIPIYSIKPMIDATKALFGTVKKPHFPLIPGSHVPCAGKNKKGLGPIHIYAAIGIGIPKDRDKNACLLMEDIGFLPLEERHKGDMNKKRGEVLHGMAKSIVAIGENQLAEYEEIYVGMKDVNVKKNEVGCALVAAPYFTLAKNAIPDGNAENLVKQNLTQWTKNINH
jgi:histidine decarboxylase